jgi:hypothetical protein
MEPLQPKRVTIRLPFFRAAWEVSESTARAIALSFLGIGVELSPSRSPHVQNIDQAIDALNQASGFVAELESHLGRRTHELETLKSEYERYSRLVEVEEEKAQAVLAEVTQTVNQGRTKERVIAFGINLAAGAVFFCLGILAQKYVFGS